MIEGEVGMGEKIWASGINIDTATGAVGYTLLELLAIPQPTSESATSGTISKDNTNSNLIRVVDAKSGTITFVERSSCFWNRINAIEDVLDEVREMQERVNTLESELEQMIRKELGGR